jgi:transcriptional regulator with XRE-family HTH domain
MAKKRKPVPTTIGQQLRELIEAHRGSRAMSAVAHEAGMKKQQLDQIINDRIKNPELATIHRILATLGIHECYGCGGTGKCPTCNGRGTV